MTTTNDDTLLRALVLLLAVFVLFPVLMMLFAAPMLGFMGSGMYWGGSVWPATVLTGLFWLLLVGLLIYGAYRFLLRDPTGDTDPALEELRLAYARGELSDEEYENRLDRLESSE